MRNSADHAIKANLSLAWLKPSETESSAIRREFIIQPGLSELAAPFPIVESSIWTRLSYQLVPDRSEARMFPPQSGIVALPQIASHVFEVRASFTGVPHRGRPIVVHAEAVHPSSRVPVAGVTWEAVLTIGDVEVAPSHTTHLEDGFVDFTFEIPAALIGAPDEDATVEIAGKLGDFEQSLSANLRIPNRLSARVQTDKPIYQPGQTLHWRAVVLDARGRAAEGAKVTLKIEDEENERVHTAELVASKYGVVHDDWLIPASASLGAYEVLLTAEGDENDRIASHSIRMSRYELPLFNVTVKPDRTAYLPGQQPLITITGAYLFGKPVPKGQVKIVRVDQPRWIRHQVRERQASESADLTIAEGTAGADGSFTANLDLENDYQELLESDDQRFVDLHFAAYYKDPASNRTEQRLFDLRITRQPIHVYVIRTAGAGSLATPAYISTSYADGRPASVAVQIVYAGRTISLRTNRYGVGKTTSLIEGTDQLGILEGTATDTNGQTVHFETRSWTPGTGSLLLRTDRTIRRAGEPVTLEITTPPEAPADQLVMIDGISGDRRLTSRIARVINHKGQVTFPYQPEFRRTIVFAAWNAVDIHRDFQSPILGSKTVIFPDGSDLKVSTSTDRSSYKPGDKASLQTWVRGADGKPVQSVLGLAIVDQAVLDRARTDNEFGQRRSWFACAFCRDEGESEIGGVRLNDLYTLKPESIPSAELDLVGEALVANASAAIWSETSESIINTPPFTTVKAQMEQISNTLDRHYSTTLEFPTDLAELGRILGKQ